MTLASRVGAGGSRLCLVFFVLTALPAAAQPFTFAFLRNDLAPMAYGSVAWGDANGDGRLDLLMTGSLAPFAPHTLASTLYLTRPAGTVSVGDNVFPFQGFESRALPLQAWRTGAAWGDHDGDGHLDLLLLGATTADAPYAGATQLLRGDGTGTFISVDAGLQPLYGGSAAWADYDGDGDQDLLLTGAGAQDYASLIYRNEAGRFTEVAAGLVPVAYGDAAWGDYDGDGDLDLALAGVVDEQFFVTRVYRNDAGQLTDIGADLVGLAFSSVDWGDYDGDGDLDLLASGGLLDPELLHGKLFVYQNTGGQFVPVLREEEGYFEGNAAWGDYDNDGDLDILAVGARQPVGTRVGCVYRNDAGTFEKVLSLVGAIFSDAAWGDYDGDGDLDLVLHGVGSGPRNLTNLYRNTSRIPNTGPAAPSGLAAQVDGDAVHLSWQAASDDHTPPAALTYNLRVGAAPGGTDVLPPLSDPATGQRRVAASGNAGPGTGWRLAGLAPGTYYWSVQAVDGTFTASPFAEEGVFTITGARGIATGAETQDLPGGATLAQNYPNPFRDRTAIRYGLPAPGHVRLVVYNVLGEAVRTLVAREEAAGLREAVWDGTDDAGVPLAAGLYVYRLETEAGWAEVRRLTLVH